MIYRVWELVLNEYVNHPKRVFLEEVEANSPQEANQIIRQYYPQKSSLYMSLEAEEMTGTGINVSNGFLFEK